MRWSLFVVMLVSVVLMQATTYARNGQYAGFPKEHREWLKTMEDKNGNSCCSYDDGYRAQSYRSNGKGYEVFYKGGWHKVPPHALILKPNRIGYPIVWPIENLETGAVEGIRCFLPGAGV